MDREAIVLYLQNVRDLEVAKYSLSQKYNKEKSTYTSKRQNLLRPAAVYKKPKAPDSVGGPDVLIMVGIFLIFLPILFLG